MKVASFIIATLFIPPHPTNLVITTSPRDIGVRFLPPPLCFDYDSYNVACSLGWPGLSRRRLVALRLRFFPLMHDC